MLLSASLPRSYGSRKEPISNHRTISSSPSSAHVLIPPELSILDCRIGRTTLHGLSFGSIFVRCVRAKTSHVATSPYHTLITTDPTIWTSTPSWKYTTSCVHTRLLFAEVVSLSITPLSTCSGLHVHFYTPAGPNRGIHTDFRLSFLSGFRMSPGAPFLWTQLSTFSWCGLHSSVVPFKKRR